MLGLNTNDRYFTVESDKSGTRCWHFTRVAILSWKFLKLFDRLSINLKRIDQSHLPAMQACLEFQCHKRTVQSREPEAT